MKLLTTKQVMKRSPQVYWVRTVTGIEIAITGLALGRPFATFNRSIAAISLPECSPVLKNNAYLDELIEPMEWLPIKKLQMPKRKRLPKRKRHDSP